MPPLLLSFLFLASTLPPVLGAPRLQVRSYRKECGRNGNCRDPLWQEFLNPWSPLELTAASGDEAITFQDSCGPKGEVTGQPLNCTLSKGAPHWRYCCTNNINTGIVGGQSSQENCVDLMAGRGVWHQVMTSIFEMQNYGIDYCVQQVLVEDQDMASQTSGQAEDATIPDIPGPPTRRLKGKPGKPAPIAAATPNTTAAVELININITHPRIDGGNLLYCLEDKKSQCGLPVAQRYCLNVRGCKGAATFHGGGAITFERGYPEALRSDNTTDFGSELMGYFDYITCSCPTYRNMMAPVHYTRPTFEAGYEDLQVNSCNTVINGNMVEDCGKDAANSYCNAMQFTKAKTFHVGTKVVEEETYVVGSRVVLDPGYNHVFDNIVCVHYPMR